MLKIFKDGSITLSEKQVNIPDKGKKAFLSGCLDFNTSFEDGLTLGELIAFLFPINDVIKDRYSCEYEVLRNLIMMGKFQNNYKCIKIHKDIYTDKGILYIIPNFDFIESEKNEKSFENVKDLPIVLCDDPNVEDEIITKKVKVYFLFNEILSILFDDVLDALRYDSVLK